MGSDDAFSFKSGSPNTPEPAPKPSEYTPAWPKVINMVIRGFTNPQAPADIHEIAGLVVADMRERDEQGAKKYGVHLQAGNGRRHLVDAYQEALDKTVYLQAWIDEHIAIEQWLAVERGEIDEAKARTTFSRLQLEVVEMFGTSVLDCLKLRSMIKLEAETK
jgi:hypothetical protein